MANNQTFTRLSSPMPEMQGVVSDIYNKLATLQGQSAQTPTTQQVTQAATAAAQAVISAAGGGGSSVPAALNGIIPVVNQNPNSSPLLDRNNNKVAALDGAVVFWNIGGSDVGVLYQYSATNGVWTYQSGQVARTQTNLSSLASLLAATDTGLLVDVTDFAHILIWTGSVWTYADPTDPAGRIEAFLFDPNPTTGWHLCDGTVAVPYLKHDGTTGTQSMPALTATSAYIKLGSVSSATLNAPTAPNFTGTPETFTTTAVTATGAVNAFTSPNPYTPAGTIDTSGQPENIALRPWFRV